MAKDQFNISDYLFNLLVNLIYIILVGVAPITPPDLGIPTALLKEYKDLLDIWNNIYGITKNKSGATPTNRTAKDTAKLNLTDFLRPFVQKYLYLNMPPCTNEIIVSCGLNPHSTTRTSHLGKPSQKPAFGAKPNGSHGFDCGAKNESGKVAKPVGVAFMRIRYFEGENAPKDPAKFTSFQDYSRIPIILNLPVESAGNTITMACCYVSKDGIEGDYSTIIVTKIP